MAVDGHQASGHDAQQRGAKKQPRNHHHEPDNENARNSCGEAPPKGIGSSRGGHA